ncbi:MAG TPA: ArsR family transcriptional regulator [Dehalococcoidia bacterium]|nr:ArsR family transcriptional regulator [Dehalococcoidia bacterium]
MKSTRDLMRDVLAARGEATVGEIAAELHLNQANIRRHLEVLRAEGLVDVRIQRHEVGRPAYVYRLTERAEEQSGHYPRLVNRMFRRIAALPADQAAVGQVLLEQVFDGVAQDIAGTYRPMVTGATVAERVAETSAALRDEGIVDHWRQDADGFHLMNTACPYRKAAEASEAPCHADTRVVEMLIGAPVVQVGRMVDGHAMCEYVVQSAGTPKTGGAKRPRARKGAGQWTQRSPRSGGGKGRTQDA